MKFNKLGQQAMLDANNYFYSSLPDTRKIMFKRAFGLLTEKSPVLRYQRDDKGGIKKETGVNYQEVLTESRSYVTDTLSTYAMLLGVTLSQVVHAFITGDELKFAAVILRRIKSSIHEETIMVWDTELGEKKPRKHNVLRLPVGHRWKGNPNSIDLEEVLKAILTNWIAVGGILTSQEQALEGGEEASAALKRKQKDAAKKNYNTSRKDSMKGVQVVNAKQKARKQLVTGA